jgi:hypothetical protein
VSGPENALQANVRHATAGARGARAGMMGAFSASDEDWIAAIFSLMSFSFVSALGHL